MNAADPISHLNAALQGRYRIERELGQGGMATVYLADDLRHERKVALKVLKPELAAVVGAERFLAEIKTTANLQHPHILPLFDSGEADSFLFYVMPYVEGESLRERLDREHQLPVDEAVHVAENVAEALDYAHSHGVIHRDIKPANILLQAGKPVVSDFGIALAVGAAGGGRLTETGLSLGTPHYMSPEQATGDLSVGTASDIYALGCVLYEMLVGEPPYTGSTPQAVLGKIVTSDAPSATAERRSVPANVDAVIRKALEKVPADRFGGARKFSEALADVGFRHRESTSTGVGGAGLWKGAAVALGTLALALAMALGWAVSRPPERPVRRFDVGLPPGVRRVASTDNVSVTISPDGATIAYVAVSSDGVTRLWVRRLTDPAAREIPGTEGASYPSFSPDGESIAIRKDGDLVIVSLGGAPPQTILPDVGVGDIAWGADGLIYIAFDGVYRMAPSLGEPEPLCVEEGVDLDWPDPLPNGRGVLVNHGLDNDSGEQSVALVILETCETRVLFPEGAMGKYAPSGHVLYTTNSGTLMAAPFDVDRLEVTGRSQPVEQGVSVGTGLASQFAISTSGDLVYHPMAAAPDRTLVEVDREGRVQDLGLPPQEYVYPRMSPDGGRLAVAVVGSDADLWVFDLARRTPTRVTFGGNNRYYVVWTPDGERLTYADGNADGNTIYVASADGTGEPIVVLSREAREFPTSWSPDGRVLAFYASGAETLRDLWTLTLGGEPEPFLVTRFAELSPIFSPDGRWMAYVSYETEQAEVYVRPYPGPGPKYTMSIGGGMEPVWSPDGSELFYRNNTGMMAVPVNPTGTELRPGAPYPLFDDFYLPDPAGLGTPNYSITPDGQRFVMVSVGGEEGAPFVYIQNFSEELNELSRN